MFAPQQFKKKYDTSSDNDQEREKVVQAILKSKTQRPNLKGKNLWFNNLDDLVQLDVIELDGEKYRMFIPKQQKIAEDKKATHTGYFYEEYDKEMITKQLQSIKKDYFSHLDDELANEQLADYEPEIREMNKKSVYQINSPQTISKIRNRDLNVEEFYYMNIIDKFDSCFGDENWDFTGIQDNVKWRRQKFAKASLKGGELDAAKYFDFNPNKLYLLDYKQNDGGTKDYYYDGNNGIEFIKPEGQGNDDKILYTGEELRYWCYGYYLSKMNFSGSQAIALSMQFFNKDEVLEFTKERKEYDLPWRIDAMLDGFNAYGKRYGTTPYIDMTKLYKRPKGLQEFDINWDMGELAFDMVLIFVTGAGYSIGKKTLEVGTKVTLGALVDISLQVALATLDGETTVEEALEDIDIQSAIYSGVETLNSNWISAAALASFREAVHEMGSEQYDYSKVLAIDFIYVAVSYIISSAFKKTEKYQRILKRAVLKNPKLVIKRLYKLKIDREFIEWFVTKVFTDSIKNRYMIIIEEVYNEK